MAWPEIAAALKELLEGEVEELTVFVAEPDARAAEDHAIIGPGNPFVRPGGHGYAEVAVSILVRCPGATEFEAQNALAAYLWPTGERSILRVIASDDTLGGSVSPLKFIGAGDIRVTDDTQRTWEGILEFTTAVE